MILMMLVSLHYGSLKHQLLSLFVLLHLNRGKSLVLLGKEEEERIRPNKKKKKNIIRKSNAYFV